VSSADLKVGHAADAEVVGADEEHRHGGGHRPQTPVLGAPPSGGRDTPEGPGAWGRMPFGGPLQGGQCGG